MDFKYQYSKTIIKINPYTIYVDKSYVANKPSAEIGSVSLVHTCTVNGLSDVPSDMTVKSMEPTDSSALRLPSKNLTTERLSIQ